MQIQMHSSLCNIYVLSRIYPCRYESDDAFDGVYRIHNHAVRTTDIMHVVRNGHHG